MSRTVDNIWLDKLCNLEDSIDTIENVGVNITGPLTDSNSVDVTITEPTGFSDELINMPARRIQRQYNFNYARNPYFYNVNTVTTAGEVEIQVPAGAGLQVAFCASIGAEYPGNGHAMRTNFTATYDTPRALTSQVIGLCSVHNNIQLGYNIDGNFGLKFSYGGRSTIVKYTWSGASIASGSTITFTLNGVSNLTYVVNETSSDPSWHSFEASVYGITISSVASVWLLDSLNDELYFTSFNEGDLTAGTYEVRVNGVLEGGSFTTLATGTSKTDVWTYENSYNINPTLAMSVNKQEKFQFFFKYIYSSKLYVSLFYFDESKNKYTEVHRFNSGNAFIIPQMPLQFLAFSLDGSSLTLKSGGAIHHVYAEVDFRSGIVPIENIEATPNDFLPIIIYRTNYQFNNYRHYGYGTPNTISISPSLNKAVSATLFTALFIGGFTSSDYPKFVSTKAFRGSPISTIDYSAIQTVNGSANNTWDLIFPIVPLEYYFPTTDVVISIPVNRYVGSAPLIGGVFIEYPSTGNINGTISTSINVIDKI